MSRIGNKPIPVPTGVDVKISGSIVSVKGPLGKLDWTLKPGIGVTVDKGQVRGHTLHRRTENSSHARAGARRTEQHGRGRDQRL